MQAARMLSRAAERLSTNIESPSGSSQTSPAATNNVSSRVDSELTALFPHHFQPSTSRNTTFDLRRSRKRKAPEVSSKAKKKIKQLYVNSFAFLTKTSWRHQMLRTKESY